MAKKTSRRKKTSHRGARRRKTSRRKAGKRSSLLRARRSVGTALVALHTAHGQATGARKRKIRTQMSGLYRVYRGLGGKRRKKMAANRRRRRSRR